MEDAVALMEQLRIDLQSLFTLAQQCTGAPFGKPNCNGFWLGAFIIGVAVVLLIVYAIKRPSTKTGDAPPRRHAKPMRAKELGLYLLLIFPMPFLAMFTGWAHLNAEVCVVCAGLAIAATLYFLAPPIPRSSNDARPELPASAQPAPAVIKPVSIGTKLMGFAFIALFLYLVALTVCFLLVMFLPHAVESKKFEVVNTRECRSRCGFACTYRIYVAGWNWGTGYKYLCMSENSAFPVHRGDTIVVDGKFYEYAAYVVNLRKDDR